MSIQKPYDLIVNIGRYEPPHLGHIRNFKNSFELSDTVLILIG